MSLERSLVRATARYQIDFDSGNREALSVDYTDAANGTAFQDSVDATESTKKSPFVQSV
ncbi:hypothetical protein SH139x_003608 [Planctomycetaceae bacterium SH139]